MRTFTQFLKSKNENREIYKIPVNELNNLLAHFFYCVRKSDYEEYEPCSLRGMLCSFDRVLRRHNYGYQISKSSEFGKTREILSAKQTDLKKQGKGNSDKKADSLNDEDIDQLFASGELGSHSPTSLLHTMWFYNTVYFGLRGIAEHYHMKCGDVKLCKDSKGLSFLEMNERNTTTRTGKNYRDKREIPQRAFQNEQNPNRCPVKAYLVYKSQRPSKLCNPEDPFYIQESNNKSGLWYKCQIVGMNKLGQFMKKMAHAAGIDLFPKFNIHELDQVKLINLWINTI